MTSLVVPGRAAVSPGRRIAARTSCAALVVLPWALGWAGAGLDGFAWAWWGWTLVVGTTAAFALAVGLQASARLDDVGTGVVRGTLLAVGIYLVVLATLLGVYGD